MGKLGGIGYDELEEFWVQLETSLRTLGSLQEVAQVFANALYERFEESVVLVRVFATAEVRQLHPRERAFVDDFCAQNSVSHQLDDATDVLSLLGSRGVEDEWNDRRGSKGHLAVPLISEQFIGEIPMLAGLLTEIGFRPAWGHARSNFVVTSLANVNGIFYVDDAKTGRDERGRSVIPAAEFVERYGVRTVFGFGGSYLSGHTFISTIVFCRDHVRRSDATKFVPMIGSLKALTTRLVRRGAIFASDPTI